MKDNQKELFLEGVHSLDTTSFFSQAFSQLDKEISERAQIYGPVLRQDLELSTLNPKEILRVNQFKKERDTNELVLLIGINKDKKDKPVNVPDDVNVEIKGKTYSIPIFVYYRASSQIPRAY